MTTTVTFSRLLREPNEVLPLLESGDILVTRREGPDVWLSLHSHHRAESEGVRLFADFASVLVTRMVPDAAEDLRRAFPWIVFLPERFRGQFVAEFAEVARGCAAIGDFRQLAITVDAWKETAAAYAAGIPPMIAESDLTKSPEDVPDPRSL